MLLLKMKSLDFHTVHFLYSDWQTKRYNQNQSCFIQIVISSIYVEINEHNLLAVWVRMSRRPGYIER